MREKAKDKFDHRQEFASTAHQFNTEYRNRKINQSVRIQKKAIEERKARTNEERQKDITTSVLHRESVSRTAARDTERKLRTLRLDNLEIESALSKYSERQDSVRRRAQSAREERVAVSLDKSLRWQRSIDDFRVRREQATAEALEKGINKGFLIRSR